MFKSRTRRLAFLLTVAVLVMVGVTTLASTRPAAAHGSAVQFADASPTVPAIPAIFQTTPVAPHVLAALPPTIVIPLPSPMWTGLSLIGAIGLARGFRSIQRTR